MKKTLYFHRESKEKGSLLSLFCKGKENLKLYTINRFLYDRKTKKMFNYSEK